MGCGPSMQVRAVTKLEFYRRKRGMSQEDLNAAARLPCGAIQQVEYGVRRLKSEEAESVSAVLGVSADKLVEELADFKVPSPRTDCGNMRCLVRDLRKEKGWTQGKLAARTGIPLKRIAAIENGQEPAGLEEAFCIAEMLGRRIDEVFQRKKGGLMGYVPEGAPANLVGKRFGKLTVVQKDGNPLLCRKGTYWVCRCDCGASCKVRADHLKSGHTTSCGCQSGKRTRRK